MLELLLAVSYCLNLTNPTFNGTGFLDFFKFIASNKCLPNNTLLGDGIFFALYLITLFVLIFRVDFEGGVAISSLLGLIMSLIFVQMGIAGWETSAVALSVLFISVAYMLLRRATSVY
jgi:hypothetical protein